MIAEQSNIPYKYSETRVYITGDKQTYSGYFEHVAGRQAWRFESLIDLLALHERLFAHIGYPQATCEMRAFDNIKHVTKQRALTETAVLPQEIPQEAGPTFVINVLYRQNASWQGTIEWIERGIELYFRSVLELIRIMDSVINAGDERWA